MYIIWNSVNLIKNDRPRKISTESFTYNAKTKRFVSDKSISSSKKSTSSKSVTTKSSGSNDNTPLGKCPVCGGDVL